jgi:stearoyl-CoA desaturase (delta-9 desaturase)
MFLGAAHAGALGALLVPSRAGVVALVVTYLLTGFGVTAGYHRRLTHRSFKATRAFDRTVAVLGLLSGEGPPIFWVAHHRKHHALSDSEHDPHSPRAGFWWAHCLWMLPRQDRSALGVLYKRWAPDLLKIRFYRVLESTFLYWHLVFAGLLFLTGLWLGGWRTGLSVLLYGFFARMVLVLHSTWLVNSACHRWGYRNHETKDGSRNNPVVALVALGEGWHNNHHHAQGAANHGQRLWEVDLTFLVILALAGASWLLKGLGLERWRLVHGLKVETANGDGAVWFT